jgi:hypothetical protein
MHSEEEPRSNESEGDQHDHRNQMQRQQHARCDHEAADNRLQHTARTKVGAAASGARRLIEPRQVVEEQPQITAGARSEGLSGAVFVLVLGEAAVSEVAGKGGDRRIALGVTDAQ